MQPDRKTHLAVRASHLGTALYALRQAMTEELDDTTRAQLTELAGQVAQHKRDTDQAVADLGEAEARYATLLEA